jgi:hypothetical protein
MAEVFHISEKHSVLVAGEPVARFVTSDALCRAWAREHELQTGESCTVIPHRKLETDQRPRLDGVALTPERPSQSGKQAPTVFYEGAQ